MASVLGGLAGAGAGFATGGPVGALLSGLGGLLGGQKQGMSAAQRAALNQQIAIQKQLMNFANSVPGTSPDEMQALAQDRGLLGGQFRNQIGALANAAPSGIRTGGGADLLSNLNQAQMGQQTLLDESHMMDALARRREALLQAANVNGQVFNMASAPGNNPTNPLGETLGQLGQAWAYNQQQKALQKQNQRAKQTQIAGAEAASGAGVQAPTGPGAVAGSVPLPETVTGSQMPEPPFAFQGTPEVGGGLLPPGEAGPTIPGTGGAFGGTGDDPVMTHTMMALHHLMQAHLHLQAKGKGKQRKKKPVGGVGDAYDSGVGDDPYAQLQAMMGGGAPMMGGGTPGMQGSGAPGNEPGGVNGTNNQIRQPQAAMLDRLRIGGGMKLPY